MYSEETLISCTKNWRRAVKNWAHFYSSVLNRRVGWKKHVGGNMVPNIIIMLDGINMLVGIFLKMKQTCWMEGIRCKTLNLLMLLIAHKISCGYQFCSKVIQNLIIRYLSVDLLNRIFNSTLHVGLNKHVGKNILPDLINMLFLIRACWTDNCLKN